MNSASSSRLIVLYEEAKIIPCCNVTCATSASSSKPSWSARTPHWENLRVQQLPFDTRKQEILQKHIWTPAPWVDLGFTLPISAARLAALEEFAAPAIAAGQLDLPPASKRKPSKTRIAILEAYAARAVALGEIVLPDPLQPKQPTCQRKTPSATTTSTSESN